MTRLPGFAWLLRQLRGVDDWTGDPVRRNTNPMFAGAGCAMSVVLVVAWAVSLIPLALFAGGRRVYGKVAGRGSLGS